MMQFISKFSLFFLVISAVSTSIAQVIPTTFEGIDASSFQVPGLSVDPNGAVGTKQYMEWVNPVYQGFDKATGGLAHPSTK